MKDLVHTFLPAVAGVLLAAGAAMGQNSSASIRDFGDVRIDGPVAHRNLAVYVLFVPSENGKRPNYLTLAEGLASKQVTVTESQRATVRQLLVTNRSSRPLFLQVGQVLAGGKQDRTLQTSFIVPPKTTDAPIPSFCVEQRRWAGGGHFGSSGMIVPRSVKQAIQERSQDNVWRGVGAYKAQARRSIAAVSGGSASPSRTSSVHEELSDRHMKKIVVDYESALRRAIAKYRHPVGVVYAVDGQLSTAEVYHSSALFRKLWPVILKSAAAEAAATGRAGRHSHPTLQQAANFLAGGWDGRWHTERLGLGNVYDRISGSSSRTGRLRYNGAITHAEIVRESARPIVVPPRPVPMPRPRPRPPIPEPHPRR